MKSSVGVYLVSQMAFNNVAKSFKGFTCCEEDDDIDIDFISDEDELICCELMEDTCFLLSPLLRAWVEEAKSVLNPVVLDWLELCCK